MLSKRLRYEIRAFDCEKNRECFTFYFTHPDDYTEMIVSMTGPENSPYSDGIFLLKFNFPEKYPFKPPRIKFLTPTYHFGVGKHGDLSIDTLNWKWSPAIRIDKLIWEIRDLLANGDPEEPLIPDIAKEFKTNYPKFHATAKEYTEKYAI